MSAPPAEGISKRLFTGNLSILPQREALSPNLKSLESRTDIHLNEYSSLADISRALYEPQSGRLLMANTKMAIAILQKQLPIAAFDFNLSEGIFIIKNASLIVTFSNDSVVCSNSQGQILNELRINQRIVYADGEYQGDVFNGEQTGPGTLKRVLECGTSLELTGFFEGDRILGADAKYSDGLWYKGEYRDGLPNGAGQMGQPNGQIYIGNFVNGSTEGQTTVVHPLAGTFTGNCIGGLLEGQVRKVDRLGTVSYLTFHRGILATPGRRFADRSQSFA